MLEVTSWGGHLERAGATDPSGLEQWNWNRIRDFVIQDLARKGITDSREVQLRLNILKNVFNGKVPNIGNRRGSKWERHDDDGAVWYTFKNDPIGAIQSVWENPNPPNLVFCAPYVGLIILKANIDLALADGDAGAARMANWQRDWAGKTVNQIPGLGETSFWERQRQENGYESCELFAGDNVWFRDSIYHDKLRDEEIDDNKKAFSGEEGSNVFYIGDDENGQGYVMSIYTQEIYTIKEYQEHMLTWNSVKYYIDRYMDSQGGLDPEDEFPIVEIRRPIVPQK